MLSPLQSSACPLTPACCRASACFCVHKPRITGRSQCRLVCKMYSTSDDEGFQQQSAHYHGAPADSRPAASAVSKRGSPWITGLAAVYALLARLPDSSVASYVRANEAGRAHAGVVCVGIAVVALAAAAWARNLKRSAQGQPNAGQQAARHKVPASEADLEKTVRTLTENRPGASDRSANLATNIVSIRQPAVSSWYPHGVGSVVSNTTVIYHPGKSRRGHSVSGSAAMTLMRLQLQYLVFLKQSDAVAALKQKAQTATPA